MNNLLTIIIRGKPHNKIVKPKNINWGCIAFFDYTEKNSQITTFKNINEKKFLIRKFNKRALNNNKCSIDLYYGLTVNDYLNRTEKK